VERCPACRARMSEPICRRCGADFSRAFAVDERANQLALQAMSLWQAEHCETAAKLLHQALLLRHNPFLEQVLRHWQDLQCRHASRALLHDKPQQALRLCRHILALRPHPFALALHNFLLQEYPHVLLE